jgi:DNA segregation ATPase FtsK/SpoIIIE-like protein
MSSEDYPPPVLGVSPLMSDEEIEARINQWKREVYVYRRNRVFEEAESFIETFEEKRPLVERYFKIPVPLPEQLAEELKRLPTLEKVKEKIESLKEQLKRFENFEQTFADYWRHNAPVNWRQEAFTMEEYIAKQKEYYANAFKAVEKACGFIRELIEAAEEVLKSREHDEVLASEPHPAVKKASKLKGLFGIIGME